MNSTCKFGTALTPDQLRHARFFDAVTAFGRASGLSMTVGAPEPPAAPPTTPPETPATPPPTTPPETPATPPPDTGYPADTPVESMKPAEQAAYWEAQARKHESRNKAILKITGGRYGDDLRALLTEHETLTAAQLTDAERAIAQATQAARSDIQREYADKLVAAEFRAALTGIADSAKRDTIIAGLNLANFVKDGEVDTDKVLEYAKTLATADKALGNQQPDYGAGYRGNGSASSGVAAGAALYAASRTKTTA